MALEESIKRSQLALSVIERAMRDATGWTIDTGAACAEAQVVVSDEGVTFWARFPGQLGDRSARRATVVHHGDALWTAHIHPPADGAFEVEVSLLVATQQTPVV